MCWQQLRVQGKPRRDNNALKRHFLSSNAFPVKAPFFFPIVPSSIGAEKKAVLTTRVGSVHNSLGSCLLKVCFYSQFKLDGEEACQPVGLASDENEKKGAQVQFYHLSSFKKKTKKKHWHWNLAVLQPNIFRFLYKWNKTLFVSGPAPRGTTHNGLYCLSSPVTHAHQWVCAAAKVNSDNMSEVQVKFQQTNFT